MAMETTFWGIIHMNKGQAEKVRQYLTNDAYNNQTIGKESVFYESSRATTLTFGKVVRGGFDERDFWLDEFGTFLKDIEAVYCTVYFEFEDKKGLFVYYCLYSLEPKGWTIYENHFDLTWDNTKSRFLGAFK